MDVEDAFTELMIDAAGTNVDGETESQLEDIIRRIYETNEIEGMSDDDVKIALLCFVAGRTYQSDIGASITVEMTLPELREYSLYLLNRSRHD